MIRTAIFQVICALALATGTSSYALECQYCEGKDLGDLIELSVSRDSGALRSQIRGWIAEKHPETPAGLVARAWVLDAIGGDLSEVERLYQEGVKRDPSLGLGFTNLGYALERQDRREEAFDAFLLGAEAWPHHEFFVQYAYFNLKKREGEAAANNWLDSFERDGPAQDWVYDYVRGVIARDKGDRSGADRHFTLALDQSSNSSALKAWLDNRLRVLSAQRADRATRLDTIREAISWANEHQSDAALRHVGKILWEDFKLPRDAHRVLSAAYDMNPSPEAAQDAFGAIGNGDFDAGIAVLNQGLRDFPDNYLVLMSATWAWSNFEFDPRKAEDYGSRAISMAPTQNQLDDAIDQYADFAKEAALYDRVIPVFEKYLPTVNGTAYRNILGDYIDNRVHARDFGQANRLLERAQDYGGFSENWLAGRENRIRTALRLQGQRDRFFAENPFLKDWEQRFGDSLRVTIEFATGKADIREAGVRLLNQAADALKALGAENYVFLIEGHTDITGSDKVNLPLSDARAKSVERYFVENANIAPERLQTVGYGSRIPLATNVTESGKQTNRRVEIRPYGNISEPQISTSGWLDARSLTLSPDGRYAVTGNTPAQVWDLERMLRVRQLPIGGSSRAISPNGRYIAMKSSFVGVTGVTDNLLYIYDMRTGLMHSQLPNSIEIDEISWSPFSDAVAYSDRTGYLRVYDLASRKFRGVTKMGTIRGSEQIAWSGDGGHIVTKTPRTSHAVVRDAKSLKPVGMLRNTGWLHGFANTPDGQYLVGMNNDYELIVWNTSDWREIARKRMPAMTFNLIAHPTEPKVMIADTFTNTTRLALVDVPSLEVTAQLQGDQDKILYGGFTPDGSHYVTAQDDQIVYLDTRDLSVDQRKDGAAHKGRGLTMVPSQNLVMSRDSAGTSVWDIKTGRRVHRIEGEIYQTWKPLNQDGSVLFAFDEDGQMLKFDATTFRSEVIKQIDGKPYSMRENDTHIVVGTVPQGDGPFQSPRSNIYVIEKATLKVVMQKSFDIVTEPVRYEGIYDPRVFVRLADNGMIAVTSSWMAGFKQGMTDGRVVTIYDALRNREVTSFQAEARYFKMEWADGGDVLKFRGKGRWYLHDPANGKYTGRETPSPNFEVELSDGRTVEWFWDHVALDGKELTFPHNLRHLQVHSERNLAIGLTTGNELIFIDLNRMEQALTIAPRKDGEWIAYTPDGRYTASLQGTEDVYWSLGDNYLPFSALAEGYERPGLIRNLLDAIARGEALPDDGADVDADVFEAPYAVSLVSPERSTTEDETFVVQLEVRKDSADLADPEIEYTLNGRRVLKSRGFEEEAFFDGQETVGLSRRFDLNPGRNVIEASLVWRDARIQTQTLEIIRAGGETPDERLAGQTLWFFGVGVSDYERSSQNLNFADRDATELAKLMESQEGKLFNRVETKVLTDADATERNVRIQMNEFLDQSADDDVVVLFLAGHGVVDEEQELYFMTHEGDLAKPYTGMSVDRFRDYLENRPLNQNALMLLDICHSGAGGNRVVADDAVQDLTKGTGAVVFASSSGSELSFEDESFGGGHGAFTAALLEGLRGLADNRVGDRNGFNSLQELVLFTSSRVPELTEGQQRPQIPALSLNVDYPLSIATN